MPQASTLALVLSSTPLNEQDKLVSLLTAERGLLKAVAPGAAKMKNRFGSLLELFTAGEFHYYWHEDKELATLSKGEIKKSFFPVVSAAENVFYFYLMAEIVLKFIPPESARHPDLQTAAGHFARPGKQTGHGLAAALFPGLVSAQRRAAVQSPAAAPTARPRS